MTNAVQTYHFKNHPLRTVLIEREPWFVAADICRALDQPNPTRVLSRLDIDEKGLQTLKTPSGDQQMLVINESGLWNLILTSTKPAAKEFKKWITAEVLPSIRTTGRYESQEKQGMLSKIFEGAKRSFAAPDMGYGPEGDIRSGDMGEDAFMAQQVDFLLEHPHAVAIVRYRRRGFSVLEIAKQMDSHRITVARVLRKAEAVGLVEPDPDLAFRQQQATKALRGVHRGARQASQGGAYGSA